MGSKIADSQGHKGFKWVTIFSQRNIFMQLRFHKIFFPEQFNYGSLETMFKNIKVSIHLQTQLINNLIAISNRSFDREDC